MMSVMMTTGSLSCRGFTNFIAENTSILSSSYAALVRWMLVKFLPHSPLFCLNCLPIWTILNLAYIPYNLPCQVFQMWPGSPTILVLLHQSSPCSGEERLCSRTLVSMWGTSLPAVRDDVCDCLIGSIPDTLAPSQKKSGYGLVLIQSPCQRVPLSVLQLESLGSLPNCLPFGLGQALLSLLIGCQIWLRQLFLFLV